MHARKARGGADRRAASVAALAAALCLAAGGAVAQGSIRVRLPDLSGLSEAESKAMLQELARVNVITSHCPGWEISSGEWMLLTATGDKLAARLGLDPEVHDRRFFGRAFRLLDDPRNCDRIGPEARPLLRRLRALGGSTEPVGSGVAAATGKPGTGRGPASAADRGPGGAAGKGNPGGGRGNSGKGEGGPGGNNGKGGGKGNNGSSADSGGGNGNGGGRGGGGGGGRGGGGGGGKGKGGGGGRGGGGNEGGNGGGNGGGGER